MIQMALKKTEKSHACVKALNMTVTVKNAKENSTKRELASLYFLFAILSAELIDDNNESGH